MKKIEIEVPEGKRAGWVDGVWTLADNIPKEQNEEIKDYNDAIHYLGLKHNEFCGCVFTIKKYKETLSALGQLFIIAEAWNKADGFTVNFSEKYKIHFYPVFKYDINTKRFVCTGADKEGEWPSIMFSRICFISAPRAIQFGKQFIDLWNKVLNKE